MSEEMSRLERRRSNKIPRGKSNGDGNNKSPKKGWAHRLKLIFLTLITLGVLGIFSGAALFTYYASSAPKITNAKLVGSSQTEFLDKDDNVFWTSGDYKRESATQSEIPQSMRNAVVAIEDRRFYKHNGVDIRRILGAAAANITGSSLGLQGGSTLTQQLVKLTVFSTAASDQTFKRKAQEAWLALQVEKEYSKNQILTLYMNKVYMGNGVYGFKTAAEYYYGKNLKDLSVPEMALLAGLPQSPSGYDPYQNPKGATSRRNEVLAAMAKYGSITEAQAQKYMKEPINTGLLSTHSSSSDTIETSKVADAYISSTLTRLKKLGYDVKTDGLIVHTNMDMGIQTKAYTLANDDNSGINWSNDKIQVALTVTNPKNGKVLAQLGGRKQNSLLGLNRATQKTRSAGSTAKPLVDYGPAIENLNWPTYRSVKDSKYTYPGTNISVQNTDGKYLGWMSMREALIDSRNIPAIRTFETVGTKNSTNFLKKLGITFDNALTASNAIGIDVSTAQEAAAYGAFSNGGNYYSPQYIKSIETGSGETKSFSNSGKQAMKSSTAFMITNMLQSVVKESYAKMVNSTSYSLAGKTGTIAYDTDANKPNGASSDVWFSGYTKSASMSVWMGYDEPNEGSNYIIEFSQDHYNLFRYYKKLMDYIMSDENADGTNWTAPSTVKKVTKDGKTEYEVAGAEFTDPGTDDDTDNASVSTSSTSKSSESSSEVSTSSESSSEASSSSESSSEVSSSSENSSETPSSSESSSEVSSSSETPSSSESSSTTSSSDSNTSDPGTTDSTNSQSSDSSNENSQP